MRRHVTFRVDRCEITRLTRCIDLPNKSAIEQAVAHLDKLVEMGRQAKAVASGEGAEVKPSLPTFKKNVSASAQSTSSGSAGPSAANVRASASASQRPMTSLEKILADATAATLAREHAAKAASTGPPAVNGRQPPALGARPPSGSGTAAPSGFRAAPGPVPMNINRPSSSDGAGSSSQPSYPSASNKWSSVARPTGATRPYDNKKRPNWRNHTIRYRDGALAEARPFEMEDYEADEPYWWSNVSCPALSFQRDTLNDNYRAQNPLMLMVTRHPN